MLTYLLHVLAVFPKVVTKTARGDLWKLLQHGIFTGWMPMCCPASIMKLKMKASVEGLL